MTDINFRLHPLAIAHMIRSYWYILTAPAVRMLVQQLIFNEVAKIFWSELFLLFFTIVFVVIKWSSVRIFIKRRKIIINKGFLIKSLLEIEFSQIFCVFIERSVIDIIFGAVDCYLYTEAGPFGNERIKIRISKSNAKILCDTMYKVNLNDEIKIERKRSRYFALPVTIGVCVTFFLIIMFYKNTRYFLTATLIFTAIYFYHLLLCYYNYKNQKIFFGDVVYAQGSRSLNVCRLYCYKSKLEYIKTIKSPIDEYHKTCKVKIMIARRKNKFFKIKNVYQQEINKIYGS